MMGGWGTTARRLVVVVVLAATTGCGWPAPDREGTARPAAAPAAPPATLTIPPAPGGDPTWRWARPVDEETEAQVLVVKAVLDLMGTRHRAFVTGDVGLLPHVWDPASPSLEKDRRAIAALADAGRRYADEGVQVTDFEFLYREEALAVLRVVHSHGPQVIVDATGRVVEEGPGWPPTSSFWTVQDRGDGWRLLEWNDHRNPLPELGFVETADGWVPPAGWAGGDS